MQLPNNRFQGQPGDDKFIRDLLARLPASFRPGACESYSEVYEQSGRREANTRLRHYVQNVEWGQK